MTAEKKETWSRHSVVYQNDTLPTRETLAAQYGVSPATAQNLRIKMIRRYTTRRSKRKARATI
jgi:hypothetical protein